VTFFFFFFQICKTSFTFYLNASFWLPNPDLVKSLAMNTSLGIICTVSAPDSKEQKEGKGGLCSLWVTCSQLALQ